MSVTNLRALALAVLSFAPLAPFGLSACDADDTAKQCVMADLVAQCPAGSNPVLGAAADEGCEGDYSDSVVEGDVGATATCRSTGSCEFMCQFATPCACGVKTLTKETIVCEECAQTSCGDGRCEGNERAVCTAGDGACVPCDEDCGGSTCGDGDCTGSESPATCPQDCGGTCQPNAKDCLGTFVRVCQANGAGYDQVDCAASGQVCRDGACVAP